MMSFRIKRKIVTVISFFIFFLSFLLCQQEVVFAKKIWKITSQNIEKVRKKAESGDPYYQAILGDAYSWKGGEGGVIKYDPEEALKWTRLAAEQKHPIGLYTLASMYQYGTPVIQVDYEKARGLYTKALPGIRKLARKGNPRALYDLGRMYEEGLGVEKDVDKASKWMTKKQEYARVQFKFALIKARVHDYDQAMKWYKKAADQGDALANNMLGNMWHFGSGVKKDDVEAAKWYRKAIELGLDTTALADLYKDGGVGVKQDYAKAAKRYRELAEEGNVYAQRNLAGLYRDGGNGLKQDYAEAAKWYKKAAVDGNVYAQKFLAALYEDGGNGLKQDFVEAVKWYKKAAEQGDSSAKKRLAEIKKEEEQAREAKLDKSYEALEAGFGQQAVKLFRKEARNYGSLDSGLFRSNTAFHLIDPALSGTQVPPLTALGQFALIAIAHADKTQTKLPLFWSSGKGKQVVDVIARGASFKDVPLEVGDVLISMDGIEHGEGRWTAHLTGLAARTPVKIIFDRNGVLHSTTVLTRAGYRGSQSGIVYFTLFEYGILAYHAGHLEITLTTAQRLQAMIDEAYVSPVAQPFIAVLEALVMVSTKGSDAALAHILDAGGLEFGVLAMYFEDYAPALWPLYKDHRKIAFLLGKDEDKIKWPKMKVPLPQPFPDLSGKLITPAAPPKLETKPKTAKPRATTKPVQETREPDVMILD